MAVKTYSDEKMLEAAIAQATTVTHIVNKNGLYTVVGTGLPDLRPTFQPPQPQVFEWWEAGGAIPASDTYTIYDPISAADLASSYSNLANPGTRDATVGVAPTHSQGVGWTFNGTSQYLNSNTTINNNSSVVIWIERAKNVFQIGTFRNTPYLAQANLRGALSNTSRGQKGTSIREFPVLAVGIFGFTDSLVFNAYSKGSGLGDMEGETLPLFIGCENQNGSPVSFGGGRIARVAIYDFELSANQFKALTDSMFNYDGNLEQDDNAYKSVVLSTNPLSYYTCNHRYGGYLKDQADNLPATANGMGFNETGDRGPSGITSPGEEAEKFIHPLDMEVNTPAFSLDQWSGACWIYLATGNEPVALRIFNMYTNNFVEYFAFELRTASVAIFIKNTTSQENTSSVAIPKDQWVHLVCYNDQANNKYGFYINGTKYESNRTIGAYTDVLPDAASPQIMSHGKSNKFQHISIYDRVLNQTEVDALYNG